MLLSLSLLLSFSESIFMYLSKRGRKASPKKGKHHGGYGGYGDIDDFYFKSQTFSRKKDKKGYGYGKSKGHHDKGYGGGYDHGYGYSKSKGYSFTKSKGKGKKKLGGGYKEICHIVSDGHETHYEGSYYRRR